MHSNIILQGVKTNLIVKDTNITNILDMCFKVFRTIACDYCHQ